MNIASNLCILRITNWMSFSRPYSSLSYPILGTNHLNNSMNTLEGYTHYMQSAPKVPFQSIIRFITKTFVFSVCLTLTAHSLRNLH